MATLNVLSACIWNVSQLDLTESPCINVLVGRREAGVLMT